MEEYKGPLSDLGFGNYFATDQGGAGVRLFLRFVQRFPDVHALAEAPKTKS